jgi:hypothetical protein
MLSRAVSAACALAAILVPLTAAADAASDVDQVAAAFKAVHSFHAVEQLSSGHTILVDHVAPDRWRVQPSANVNEVVIGDSVYMNGKLLPASVGQLVQSNLKSMAVMATDEVKRSVRDLGWQSVGGVRVHVYSFTANNVPETLYVGPNHLPVRAVVQIPNGTVTITYSRYNAPIVISP